MNNSNNGLIEYKNNFITRIRNFFKRIFKRNINTYPNEKEFNNNTQDDNKKDKFIDDIKIDYNAVDIVVKKTLLLQEIEENDEVLNTLSIGKLRELEEYYDNVIKDNEEKIRKLQEAT